APDSPAGAGFDAECDAVATRRVGGHGNRFNGLIEAIRGPLIPHVILLVLRQQPVVGRDSFPNVGVTDPFDNGVRDHRGVTRDVPSPNAPAACRPVELRIRQITTERSLIVTTDFHPGVGGKVPSLRFDTSQDLVYAAETADVDGGQRLPGE